MTVTMNKCGNQHLWPPTYESCFSAQFEAIGAVGQRRLKRANVVVVGAGGLGTAISNTLAMSGVGALTIVDPQQFEVDNLNRSVSARICDVGRHKADVLGSALLGRPYLSVAPIVSRAELLEDIIGNEVTIVVTACNTPSGRRATARFACGRALPHVSAGLADGRRGFGGAVMLWSPYFPKLACPACFVASDTPDPSSEALFSPVVSIVGALAAWSVVELIIGSRRLRGIKSGNCIAIDLEHHLIERCTVLRRHDCRSCAPQGRTP